MIDSKTIAICCQVIYRRLGRNSRASRCSRIQGWYSGYSISRNRNMCCYLRICLAPSCSSRVASRYSAIWRISFWEDKVFSWRTASRLSLFQASAECFVSAWWRRGWWSAWHLDRCLRRTYRWVPLLSAAILHLKLWSLVVTVAAEMVHLRW